MQNDFSLFTISSLPIILEILLFDAWFSLMCWTLFLSIELLLSSFSIRITTSSDALSIVFCRRLPLTFLSLRSLSNFETAESTALSTCLFYLESWSFYRTFLLTCPVSVTGLFFAVAIISNSSFSVMLILISSAD